MKKYIAVLVVPLFVLLSACGGSDDKSNAKEAEVTNVDAGTDVPEGTWATEDKENEVAFVAEVGDGKVTVYWSNSSNKKKDVYWIGSFPKKAFEVFNSQPDTKALENELLASTDAEKQFKYEDDTLSFPFSIGGIDQTIHLTKE